MKPKMIRVHENFKKVLENTLTELNKHSDKPFSMLDLTEILAGNSNGEGMLSLKLPILIVPTKKKPGRPSKPLFERYVNIVLEDEPR